MHTNRVSPVIALNLLDEGKRQRLQVNDSGHEILFGHAGHIGRAQPTRQGEDLRVTVFNGELLFKLRDALPQGGNFSGSAVNVRLQRSLVPTQGVELDEPISVRDTQLTQLGSQGILPRIQRFQHLRVLLPLFAHCLRLLVQCRSSIVFACPLDTRDLAPDQNECDGACQHRDGDARANDPEGTERGGYAENAPDNEDDKSNAARRQWGGRQPVLVTTHGDHVTRRIAASLSSV